MLNCIAHVHKNTVRRKEVTNSPKNCIPIKLWYTLMLEWPKSIEEIALAFDSERHPKVLVHPDLPAQARRHHHQAPRVAAVALAAATRGGAVARVAALRLSGDAAGLVVADRASAGGAAVAGAPGRRRRLRPGDRGGHVLAVEVLVGADGAPRLGLHADADGRGRRHPGGPPQVHVRVLARAHGVPPVRGVGRRDLAARVLETFWKTERGEKNLIFLRLFSEL